MRRRFSLNNYRLLDRKLLSYKTKTKKCCRGTWHYTKRTCKCLYVNVSNNSENLSWSSIRNYKIAACSRVHLLLCDYSRHGHRCISLSNMEFIRLSTHQNVTLAYFWEIITKIVWLRCVSCTQTGRCWWMNEVKLPCSTQGDDWIVHDKEHLCDFSSYCIYSFIMTNSVIILLFGRLRSVDFVTVHCGYSVSGEVWLEKDCERGHQDYLQ